MLIWWHRTPLQFLYQHFHLFLLFLLCAPKWNETDIMWATTVCVCAVVSLPEHVQLNLCVTEKSVVSNNATRNIHRFYPFNERVKTNKIAPFNSRHSSDGVGRCLRVLLFRWVRVCVRTTTEWWIFVLFHSSCLWQSATCGRLLFHLIDGNCNE